MKVDCTKCAHAHKIDETTSVCDATKYDTETLDCFMPRDLSGTAVMMTSADYKERFKAEYYQTKMRYNKLHKMIVKYEAGTLDFKPTCHIDLLKEQAKCMGMYLRCLEIRAEIEKIDL